MELVPVPVPARELTLLVVTPARLAVPPEGSSTVRSPEVVREAVWDMPVESASSVTAVPESAALMAMPPELEVMLVVSLVVKPSVSVTLVPVKVSALTLVVPPETVLIAPA